MNKYDLFDAFSGIDDDLLQRSEERKTTRRIPFRKALIAAAAVMALAVTAIAAPILREFLFPDEPVLVSEGKRHIYGDLYRDIEKDEYRIDLNVSSSDPLPTQIEEVRLPQYMIENNWLVAYGEVDAVYSEGPVHFKWWDRETPKWVTFEQLCIPAEGVTFKLETYHGAEVSQETVTVGDVELRYLNIPGYVNHDTWESYPEVTAVYWSDGAYAYHLECSRDVTDAELAEIVMSVAAVEDVTPYLKDDPNNDGMYIESLPLDVHRMPTAMPDGYELKVCADDGWVVTWIWENDAGNTIWFIESHSNIQVSVIQMELFRDQLAFEREDLTVNDRTVYTFHYDDTWEILWDDGICYSIEGTPIKEGHVYSLEAEGDDAVDLDALLDIMESVTEVPDISDYVTS